jgi:hypothetical protein
VFTRSSPSDAPRLTRQRRFSLINFSRNAIGSFEQVSPDAIREQGVWPKGFLPLPHPFHPTGGFVFPKEEIDAMKQQGAT